MTTFIVGEGLHKGLFGYTESSKDNMFIKMFVLAASVLDGGDPLMIDHCVLTTWDNVRLATSNDFGKFMVSEEGFREKEDLYNYIRL